jgi:hypothetical protein
VQEPQSYALPSFGLQMYGPVGFPFESATGPQQFVVNPVWPTDMLHSFELVHRHCWPVALLGGIQAPPPLGTGAQQPFAGGQLLLVLQVVAHALFPAVSV